MSALRYILPFLFLLLNMTEVSAQCFLDRHNTSVNDGWISCEKTQSPRANLGEQHWIMYEFPEVTNLYKTHVWNVNQSKYLHWGAKTIRIDYSLNGSNWSNAGLYTIQRAPGISTYSGNVGPDLQGIAAKYLLLTVVDTYEGKCAGLSEWRFYTEEANTNELVLDLQPCVNEDVFLHVNGGMNAGGTYAGPGVINNYDDSFDFDPELAGPGVHPISYTYGNGQVVQAEITVKHCTEAYCLPCRPCDENDQAIYDANPVATNVYNDREITSVGSISTGGLVHYKGSEYVDLLPNFNTSQGAYFIAEIAGCEDDSNLLSNGTLDSSTSDWSLYVSNLGEGVLSHDTTEFYKGGGSAKILVTAGQENWHVQFQQLNLSVVAGKTYSVSFFAKTLVPFSSWCALQLQPSPWTIYGGRSAAFTTEWSKLSFDIEVTESSPEGQALFYMNMATNIPNIVWIDEISIIEKE